MSLREQLLEELRMQNEVVAAQIKDLDAKISAESFAMSTVTGGALASAARSACQARMDAAMNQKTQLKQSNAWVEEMLSKYK